MRPRIHVELTPADRKDVATWSRRMLKTFGFVVMAFLALSLLQQTIEQDASAFAQARPRTSPCMGWDDAASDAIIRSVQSKSDSDLRQVGDAIVRMRRARRNCEAGWVALACQDYQAIVQGAPGHTMQVASPPVCPAALAEDTTFRTQR